jgi:hypothetical protein
MRISTRLKRWIVTEDGSPESTDKFLDLVEEVKELENGFHEAVSIGVRVRGGNASRTIQGTSEMCLRNFTAPC